MTPLLIPYATNPLVPELAEIIASVVFVAILTVIIARVVVPRFEATYAERTAAIQGGMEGLRIGQFVTVLAATDAERSGLALPRGSVVRSANGQDVVYAHTAAERYEARPVRVAPLDGARVLVEAGVKPGTRVVVQGAELLDQVR